MAYVVTDNCKDCLFTDCVEECPVDCFWSDGTMMYIDPETCVDCNACAPACPVNAIFPEDEVPDSQKSWIGLNREKTAGGSLENVTERRDPLPTADEKKKKLGL